MKNVQDFRSFGGKLLKLFFGKRHRINFFLVCYAMKESKKKRKQKLTRGVT